MVPLLEQDGYDGRGTNPPAAEEQRDILRGTQARVDVGQLGWSYVCPFCNLGKSSNLSGRDTVSGRVVVLFNPRRQRWSRHFAWSGARLVGLTPCGRATVDVLNMNAPHRIELRQLLIAGGVFPPE
jgi:hypothetical protein